MKRRDFLKVSSAAGLAGLAGPAYDALAAPGLGRETGFDLHPFIKGHPEAVFINITSVDEKTNNQAIHDAAYKLAGEMFVKTKRGRGFPNSTKITCKPNWTCSRIDPRDQRQTLASQPTLILLKDSSSLRNVGSQGVLPEGMCMPPDVGKKWLDNHGTEKQL